MSTIHNWILGYFQKFQTDCICEYIFFDENFTQVEYFNFSTAHSSISLFIYILFKSSIQLSGRKRPIRMSGKSVRLRTVKNVDMLIGAENCTGSDIKWSGQSAS